jgi:peptide/nickel transport system permease protein
MARVSFVALGLLVVMAVFAPYLAPHDPYFIELGAQYRPPSRTHWLGTDSVGRDSLSRLIYAGRISLAVGLVAVSVSMAIGMALGTVAGFWAGRMDNVLSRAADVVLSFPKLIIILTLVAVIGPSIVNVMLVIGLLEWPQFFRLMRGQCYALKGREYVDATRALGARDGRIIFRHVLPNALAPIIVEATLRMATAILTEAALSFLGMGVQPPLASWGNMLTDAQSLTVLSQRPWLWIPPGIMISVTVLSINFLGDGLQDALNPRLVQRGAVKAKRR